MKQSAKIKIKDFSKFAVLLVFLYVAFFSIQNFWQGYHDLDLSFNMLNQGHMFDVDTNGNLNGLGMVYMRGLNQMSFSFIWLCLDCILGVCVGWLYKK